ncbi:MAG: PEGA domain-containing protein, partial [Myxococcales bacterium]|nr:PEGA domain-containing protein [Myxococcales bacterium]
AEPALLKAADVLSGHPAARAEAIDALVLLARACNARRDEDCATQAFNRVLRLNADFKLDPAGAPPSLMRRFEAAQALQNKRGVGRLRARSEPVATAIFVDGTFRGVSPLYLTDLPPGVHHVRLTTDGYRDELKLVTITANRETRLDARLNAAAKAALLEQIVAGLPDDLNRIDADALGDLKALSFADQAILVAAAPPWLRGGLFDLKTGRQVRIVEVPLDGDGEEAGRTLIRELYRGLDFKAPGAVKAEPLPPPAETGSRWWLWSSIAAGAAVAVAVPLILWATEDEQKGLKRRDGAGAVVIRF